MPRAAGDGTHYRYVLQNLSNGRYDQTDTIELVSVTTVIGETLAKPALIRYTHAQTRDNIAGLVDYLANTMRVPAEEIVDMLSDEAMLKEYLTENKLRPEDMMRDRSLEGNAAHKFMERVCKAEDPLEYAVKLYGMMDEDTDGMERAILTWFFDTEPQIISSEKRVKSLRHGFAGTMDLAYWTPSGLVRKCDLKTRGIGRCAYESDFIQVGAYDIADEEEGAQAGDELTVLIVREDGTLDEYLSPYPREVFLDLLSVYKAIKGVKR